MADSDSCNCVAQQAALLQVHSHTPYRCDPSRRARGDAPTVKRGVLTTAKERRPRTSLVGLLIGQTGLLTFVFKTVDEYL